MDVTPNFMDSIVTEVESFLPQVWPWNEMAKYRMEFSCITSLGKGQSRKITHQNIVKQFLAKKGEVQIDHPPCSPDLNPPDFFLSHDSNLFRKVRFDDILDIQQNITRYLNTIPKENFLQSLMDMHSKSLQWIVMVGDYFKGQHGNLH